MLTIKPLQSNDKSQWLALWQNYLIFYQTDLPQAISDNTWQKITDDNSPIFGFGAWQNKDNVEEMVGFVHVVLHPNTWNDTDCCYLEDLFVSERVRGQGVGRALIEHIYNFANAKHCNRVYWVTTKDNYTAQALYDKVAKKTDFIQYRKTL